MIRTSAVTCEQISVECGVFIDRKGIVFRVWRSIKRQLEFKAIGAKPLCHIGIG